MEKIVLDYLDFGNLPLRKWPTTEIIGLSHLGALRLESLQSVVELGTPYMSKQQEVIISSKKLKDNCCMKCLETLTVFYTSMSIIGQNSILNLGTLSQKRIYSNA